MFEDYLESGWTYKAVTNGVDSGGAPSVTYGAAVKFNAFVQRLSANEQRKHGKLAVMSTHTIFTDKTGIHENYAIYDPDGREYRVLFVDDVNRLGHHIEIEAELVR